MYVWYYLCYYAWCCVAWVVRGGVSAVCVAVSVSVWVNVICSTVRCYAYCGIVQCYVRNVVCIVVSGWWGEKPYYWKTIGSRRHYK